MKKLLFLLLSFILSCSVNKELKKINLDYQLRKWENFVLKGDIKISYKQFQFIKNIKIKNKPEGFLLVIYDSGIFAGAGDTILSVRIDSVLTLKSKFMQDLPVKISRSDISNFFKQLRASKKQILQKKIFQKQYLKIYFNPKYEIKKITYKDYCLIFNYLNGLKSLEFYKGDNQIFKINVYSVIFGELR